HQHLEGPAAHQADGEGAVLAHPEVEQRRRPGLESLLAGLEHRSLDTATGQGAADAAFGIDQHGGAHRPGNGTPRADDRRDGAAEWRDVMVHALLRDVHDVAHAITLGWIAATIDGADPSVARCAHRVLPASSVIFVAHLL